MLCTLVCDPRLAKLPTRDSLSLTIGIKRARFSSLIWLPSFLSSPFVFDLCLLFWSLSLFATAIERDSLCLQVPPLSLLMLSEA